MLLSERLPANLAHMLARARTDISAPRLRLRCLLIDR